MGAKVCQIDLSLPLPALRARCAGDALWVLVKFGPRPLGWVKCDADRFGGKISDDQLGQLISETLCNELHDAARERQFESTRRANMPSISIVAHTRENAAALQTLLLSLTQVQYPNFEVIVVDNAPKTDQTHVICNQFAGVHRVVEPRPGIAYARNTAWQAARNEIIVLVSDETTLDSQYLWNVAENFGDPSVRCVVGATLPAELDAGAADYFERHGEATIDFDRRVFLPGGWNASFPRALSRLDCELNLSIRRSAIESIGGFDPALPFGAELDAMTRVLRSGGVVIRDPRAICFYQQRQTIDLYRARARVRGRAFASFCGKYFHDAELANLSLKMLARWTGSRLRSPLGGFNVAELAGAFLGVRSYRRDRRHVRSDALRFRKSGIVRMAA